MASDDELCHLLGEEGSDGSEGAETTHLDTAAAVAVQYFEAANRRAVGLAEAFRVPHWEGRRQLKDDVMVHVALRSQAVKDRVDCGLIALAEGLEPLELTLEIIEDELPELRFLFPCGIR